MIVTALSACPVTVIPVGFVPLVTLVTVAVLVPTFKENITLLVVAVFTAPPLPQGNTILSGVANATGALSPVSPLSPLSPLSPVSPVSPVSPLSPLSPYTPIITGSVYDVELSVNVTFS